MTDESDKDAKIAALKAENTVLASNLEAEKMAGRQLAAELEDARAEIALLKSPSLK